MRVSCQSFHLFLPRDVMDPPAATEKHIKRCHKRLSPDAYALLCRRSIIVYCDSWYLTDHFVDFFDNISRSSTSAQNVELRNTIRKLPGCEWCTVATVRRYFTNKRAQERRKAKASLIEVKAEPPSSRMLPYSPSPVDDGGYPKIRTSKVQPRWIRCTCPPRRILKLQERI